MWRITRTDPRIQLVQRLAERGGEQAQPARQLRGTARAYRTGWGDGVMDVRKERERALMLHDSLDHIRRVANAARCPTRRLDWIAERARRALEGIEYDPFDMPQYPKASKNNTNCRTCHNFDSRPWRCSLTADGVVCTDGDRYVPADPVRLYEKEGK